MTAVAGSAFTAAQFNTFVRDNLLETGCAKATAAGQYFVATGPGGITTRSVGNDSVATSQTTSSTSYTNLATTGPSITLTSGTRIFTIIYGFLSHATAGQTAYYSWDISGASSFAASNVGGIQWTSPGASYGARLSYAALTSNMTAGSNTFTAKYKSSTAGSNAAFAERAITVMPF